MVDKNLALDGPIHVLVTLETVTISAPSVSLRQDFQDLQGGSSQPGELRYNKPIILSKGINHLSQVPACASPYSRKPFPQPNELDLKSLTICPNKDIYLNLFGVLILCAETRQVRR